MAAAVSGASLSLRLCLSLRLRLHLSLSLRLHLSLSLSPSLRLSLLTLSRAPPTHPKPGPTYSPGCQRAAAEAASGGACLVRAEAEMRISGASQEAEMRI